MKPTAEGRLPPGATGGNAPPSLGVVLVLGAATVAGVLGALWLAGWRPAMFPSGLSDSVGYFTPKNRYTTERLAHLALPLWNPFEYCGLPFLATVQPAVFYLPGRLVYAFLGGDAAHVAFFFLHVALAALFTLLLLRNLGCGAVATMLGVAWVVRPAWLVAIYDHPGYLASVAWLPALLLLTRRVVLAPSARSAALLGAAAALQALAGYTPFVIATAYLLVLSLPIWWVEAGRARRGAVLAAFGLALLAAALLTAAQTLPSVEFLPLSARAEDTRAAQLAFERLEAATPRAAVLFNMPAATVVDGAARAWADHGPLLLALALAAVVLAARRPIVWWALAVAAFACLAPLGLVYRLPGYSLVRSGVEWWFIAPFALHLLAALGLGAVVLQLRMRRAVAAGLTLALVAGVIAWSWQGTDTARMLVRSVEPPRPPVASLVECLGPERAFRIYWPGADERGTAFDSRLESVVGYEPSMRPARMVALLGRLGLEGPDWVAGLAAHPAVASRLALRCVQSVRPEPGLEAAGWERIPTSAPKGALHAKRDTLPRWRLAHAATWVPTPEAALDAVFAAGLPPATVVLEGPARPLAPCAGAGADRLVATAAAPEEIAFEVGSACEAYLVLADGWAPGWTAIVDGRPAAVERADYAFRAVRVPAGEHHVVLRYRPLSVRAGLAFSLLGVALVAGLAALPSRRDFIARAAAKR